MTAFRISITNGARRIKRRDVNCGWTKMSFEREDKLPCRNIYRTQKRITHAKSDQLILFSNDVTCAKTGDTCRMVSHIIGEIDELKSEQRDLWMICSANCDTLWHGTHWTSRCLVFAVYNEQFSAHLSMFVQSWWTTLGPFSRVHVNTISRCSFGIPTLNCFGFVLHSLF